MKRLTNWIIGVLSAGLLILFGCLIRQPKMNRLKKQLELLQKDNGKLQILINSQKKEFRELLVQHKTLKAFSLIKRTSSKDRITENLVMQYGLKAYVDLLLKRVKCEQKLTKSEISFFCAYERFINGNSLSTLDKEKIKKYILEHYATDIKNLKECDDATILQAVHSFSESK